MGAIEKDINALVDLFQKDEATIRQIIETNPASFLARVLQVQHEIENNQPANKIVQQTALYGANPKWYEFLINQLTAAVNPENVSDHFAVKIPRESEVAADENITTAEPPARSLDDAEEVIKPQENLSEAFVEARQEVQAGAENSDTAEAIKHTEFEAPVESIDTALMEIENPTIEPDNDGIAAHENAPAGEWDSQPGEPEQNEEQNLIEDTAKQNEDGIADESTQQAHVSALGVTDEKPTESQPEITAQEEPKLAGGNANADGEVAVPFEPLHTVDYFASQGIKLNEADLANDKLSRQVKSFTGWLKSMKKLHPGKLPEQDEVIQQIIQNAAEVSNVESDVLTEAMAEVFVKQNKKEKAVEMYEKLSLMNPSKSAYFAAKILSLKNS